MGGHFVLRPFKLDGCSAATFERVGICKPTNQDAIEKSSIKGMGIATIVEYKSSNSGRKG